MASGQEFVILISIFLAVSSAQNGVRGKKNANNALLFDCELAHAVLELTLLFLSRLKSKF